jgi:hypothetical protein
MMLCERCHHEAPMTSDPQIMLSWAITHRPFLSIVFDEYRQAIEEAKLLDMAHLWRDSDRTDLPRYMRAIGLDFHPQSTRLDRFKLMVRIGRRYLEERQFEQGMLFGGAQ